MHNLLDGAIGARLEPADFRAEFDARFWKTDSLGFWKLERQQFFQEPGYDSWEAFAKGDWTESLRLLETGRADMESYFRRADDRRITVRRVRVVEEPLTGYLQWEMHVLRMREQCGAGIRVVGPQHVAPFEHAGQLPEVFTLGSKMMYEAVYDEYGILEYVLRYNDRELLRRCQKFVASLYAVGEPLGDYFDRQVVNLPAPEARVK